MSHVGDLLKVLLSDGANLDAFSRLRVSIPKLRLSALFDEDLRPLYWDTSVAATGTVIKNTNHLGADLAAPASGDEAILQTKEYFVYRAGQSQQVMVTLNFQGLGTNVVKEAGYFDDNNGLFFRVTGAGAFVVVRSDASGGVLDNAVAQTAWNKDTFDGSGDANNPSGILVDWTTTQILVMDFQALFVGRVRFWLDIDGILYPAHEFNHANVESIPYMGTAKLPVRYRIDAIGAPTNATMLAVCSTVNREGGNDEPSTPREVDTSASTVGVGTAWETVVGVRLRTANIRATIRAIGAAVTNHDTADPVQYAVIVNPGGTGGAAWADLAQTGSVSQYSRSNLAISIDGSGDPSTGVVFPAGGYAAAAQGGRGGVATADIGDVLPIVADIAGTPDEVWVIARGMGGAISGMNALLQFLEIR